MTREQDMVEDFHRAFGLTVGDPAKPAIADAKLRYELIREELEELRVAMDTGDLVAAADALADLQYVVLGSAVTFGIDLGPVFFEVHESNMRKRGGTISPTGKLTKPEGWKAPDVSGVLDIQVALRRMAR